MSRSVKKKPIHSVTCSGARANVQKEWKNSCNKKLRRKPPEEISDGAEYRRLSGDIWDSPSDGKTWSNPKDKKNYRK